MSLGLITNQPYPNRVQLTLGSFVGPITNSNANISPFDPRRDISLYVDGDLISISNFNYDALNNRYLIYTESTINTAGVVQAVYHIPVTPFRDANLNSIPGFALLATYTTSGDGGLTAAANLIVNPSSTTANTPVNLIWSTQNVAQIRITGTSYDSGYISLVSTEGLLTVEGGFASTITLTMACYDSTQTAIEVNGQPLTATATLTIT